MANLSDVAGSINVISDVTVDYKLFWEAIKATQYGDYNFTITEEEEDLDTDTVSFSGTGRWVFINNLNYFGTWAVSSPLYINLNSITKRYKEYLESIPFVLRFEFSDFECGCEVAYDAEYTISHNANTPLSECVTTEQALKNYNFNCYELAKFDYFDGLIDAFHYMAGYDWTNDSTENYINIFRDSIKAYKNANPDSTEATALLEFNTLIEHIEDNISINNITLPLSLLDVIKEFY